MAKSSRVSSSNRITGSEAGWVTLRSLVPCRVVVTGEWGIRYEWPAALSEVKVMSIDKDKLLAMRRYKTQTCCGGRVEPKPVFELVEGEIL